MTLLRSAFVTALLALSALLAPASAQTLGVGRSASVAAYDVDTLAWIASVQAAGATVSGPQAERVDQLIAAWKSNGTWPLLDRVWLFAAENPVQALIDLKARGTASAVNSPTFTALRGYKGSHLSAYINTGVNLSTFGGLFSRNSANYGVWIETAESTPSGSYRLMGNDSSQYSEIALGAGNAAFSINQGSAGGTGLSATGLFGCLQVSRPASNSSRFGLNGTALTGNSAASIAVANSNMNILAGNNAGTPFQQSDARAAAAWFGAGLTDPQMAALYVPLRAYMTAAGVS